MCCASGGVLGDLLPTPATTQVFGSDLRSLKRRVCLRDSVGLLACLQVVSLTGLMASVFFVSLRRTPRVQCCHGTITKNVS